MGLDVHNLGRAKTQNSKLGKQGLTILANEAVGVRIFCISYPFELTCRGQIMSSDTIGNFKVDVEFPKVEVVSP